MSSILKELSILVSCLPSLIVILGGIWKALGSAVRQFQRRLDLRESRVLARQQAAVEKAHAECLVWAFAFAAVFILFVFVKSAPQA